MIGFMILLVAVFGGAGVATLLIHFIDKKFRSEEQE